ncbi:hypothetical protein FRZ40_43355 [Paraburkholderia azotifigens]|uniref:Uncharacterized protein n=1 Tax=Paraburkholderia azotifigens TaxID=2057004 RepID=A0A5C6V7M2_9BURK|nr:hypothetical protein FRZ40_43355 [Paraburkholderia azotifigens]
MATDLQHLEAIACRATVDAVRKAEGKPRPEDLPRGSIARMLAEIDLISDTLRMLGIDPKNLGEDGWASPMMACCERSGWRHFSAIVTIMRLIPGGTNVWYGPCQARRARRRPAIADDSSGRIEGSGILRTSRFPMDRAVLPGPTEAWCLRCRSNMSVGPLINKNLERVRHFW